jgi:hypothetical protein
MDKEDCATAVSAMYQLAIEIDHELGIRDADVGSYD